MTMSVRYTRILVWTAFILGSFTALQGQNGTLRGTVLDAVTGEPVAYATVRLAELTNGTSTDLDGFFTLASLAPGSYTLLVNYLGYQEFRQAVEVRANAVQYQRVFLQQDAIELGQVDISAQRQAVRTEVRISQLAVTPQEIRSLPATGGEADIAQYLPVLPGVILSGDQGGQLYIRGGSPVQNRVLLDGMVIYNPFHSIGLFSVFETETIRGVDVLTAGFNAEHGGRVSAVVDIKTREGNKKRLAGLVSASPFQAKALLEGPIKPLKEDGGGSISFLLTGKHSYLDQTSKALYGYAVDSNFYSFARQDTSLTGLDIGLPYQYTDLYGKLSFLGENGSKVDLFGFNFTDQFNFVGLARLQWDAIGAGSQFTLAPLNSSMVINGTLAYSKYDVMLSEADDGPRRSGINTYSGGLNFTYYGAQSELNYGFEFTSLNTDFQFRNPVGLTFQQEDFTTELAGYAKYRQQLGKLILEPGLRIHYYASQAYLSLEPRLGIKYNITDALRVKAGFGRYSQNLISTVNDLDVVNFFVGFLVGPEETLYQPGTRTPTANRLQTARHAVVGLEADLGPAVTLMVEPYYKDFNQVIEINRNKLAATDPDFVVETGEAYGIDVSLRYQADRWYVWATYSLGHVNRDDGEQVYPTIFDRRHNVNLLVTRSFGARKQWEFGARWNLGSGFPFTQTQGFYQDNRFADLLQTDILTGNYPIGTLLSTQRNGGRMSYFHRLDLSLKHTLKIGNTNALETTLSVTNAYDRDNVFYVDRLTNRRVNQLPVLPSVNLTYQF